MSDLSFTRKFMPKELSFDAWENLKPYADDLLNREWKSLADFQQWLVDWSEFQIVIGEEGAWRGIRPTLNTIDKVAEEAYNNFLNVIESEYIKLDDQLTKKALNSSYVNEFKQDGFDMLVKRWKSATELYREENIPLQMEDGIKNMESTKIKGSMSVVLDGETLTLQQAGARFEWPEREKREQAWRAIAGKMYEAKDKIDENFSELVALRHKVAQNAGFENYRDYKFKELQRFDYGPKEAKAFHDSIRTEVMPLVKVMQQDRMKKMGLTELRPWDVGCDPLGHPALKAFETADELIEKSLKGLNDLDPYFAETIQRMKDRNYLDLDSRPNKAPGGYNCGLPESGTSFMFYNVAGRASDIETFVHESGHAVHQRLTDALPLQSYKSYPMEVAEFASMSMELFNHDVLHYFFPKEDELRRVQYDHLSSIISFFPRMARVDAFQHKIYEHPDLNAEQRHDMFEELQRSYDAGVINWCDFSDNMRTAWHGQLHIFEVPFYYIEYGIAQLGALQIWRNFKQDKKQALAQYKNALSLGYTKSIPEIYEAAGIKFDFSADMLKELMAFTQKEMAKLT